MIEMETAFLRDVMPQNLLEDVGVRNAADAIDTELKKISVLYIECLLISRIDELPSDIINILARQWHVDFYDDTLPIETRRNLVKQSIAWHRIKGTKAAMEAVIRTAFNTGRVTEWFEYGGDPYHFKVDIIGAPLLDAKDIERVLQAIYTTKNTRSWLDEMGFIRVIEQKRYRGCAMTSCRAYVIGPPQSHDAVIQSGVYKGVAVQTYKEVIIE